MGTGLTASAAKMHVVLTVVLLVACVANLALVWGRL